MLGFLFGTACLVGLIKVLRHGRHGHGWGRGRFGRGPWAGGLGPRRMLRGLFERLGTSPGQENVITDAANELLEAAAPLREEMRATRRDVALALRAPSLDEVVLGELFARHDDVLREARKRAVGAVARVHDALDDRQREALASLLEGGRRSFRGGALGPYRGVSL